MKVREERRCDGWDFGEGVLGGWIYLIKSTEDLGMKRSVEGAWSWWMGFWQGYTEYLNITYKL